MMDRDEALRTLRGLKGTLEERFGVTGLALFGSVARDEAGEGSDVDIWVRFDGACDVAAVLWGAVCD